MVLIGCTPADRHIEQHDVFFGIGDSLKDLVPAIKAFWPSHKLHVDGWREIASVDGFEVKVVSAQNDEKSPHRLFFLNLGGYKENEFEEFHYKMVVAATDKGEAIRQAKSTAFYKHTGFKGAESHIDDKYGVDVDDVYEITDILDVPTKSKYKLLVQLTTESLEEDKTTLGYFKIDLI